MKCPRCKREHSSSWDPSGGLCSFDDEECDDDYGCMEDAAVSVDCNPTHLASVDHQYKCSRCGGDTFEVFGGNYRTIVRCPTCLYEQCVHDG